MTEKEKTQEAPEGWETLYIRNKAILEYGEGLPEEKRKQGDVPVYGSNGIVGYHDNDLIKGPGIIIGRKGTVGAVNFTTENYWPIDTTYYIRFIGEENDIKWFYYYLTTLNLTSLNSATGVPGLNREDVYDLKIKCPPFPEQRAIASILSTCDEAIEKTDAKIEKLKRIKQGLMQDLFCFGIDENGKMRSEAAHRFKDSPLGRIPEEWENKKFSDICKVRQGLQIAISKRFHEDGKNRYQYITVQYLNDPNSFNDFVENPPKSVICKKDDILLTRTGNTGMVVTDIEGVFHNNFFLIDYDRNKLHKDYLKYFLNWDVIQNQFLINAGVTTIPDLKHGDFYNTPCLYPKLLEEQQRIASILSHADETIQKEQDYKQKLLSLKLGLMEDLLSGEVRVNKLIKDAA
jgi:type I restriction enzyme S subunit